MLQGFWFEPGRVRYRSRWVHLAIVNTFGERRSYLGIWDAAAFPGPPRAEVHVPQRVPNGLHGNWFPAA